MAFDINQTDNDALMSQYISSRYFSPRSLLSNNLTQDVIESSLSIFHNDIRSLNRNLENLVTHYLQELGIDGFHSDVIRLQSQKSEVLRILIYTRLKINKKQIFV